LDLQTAMDALFQPLDEALGRLIEDGAALSDIESVTLDESVDVATLRNSMKPLNVTLAEVGQMRLIKTMTVNPREGGEDEPVSAIRCEFLTLKLGGQWCLLPLSGAHGIVDEMPDPRPSTARSPLDALGDAIAEGLLDGGAGLATVTPDLARGVYPDAMVDARGPQMDLAADRLIDLAQTVKGLSPDRGILEVVDLRANLYAEGPAICGQLILKSSYDATGALNIHETEVAAW